jgi:hypothetical protein
LMTSDITKPVCPENQAYPTNCALNCVLFCINEQLKNA